MEGEEDPKELARDLAQKAVAFIRNKYDSEKPYPYTVYVLAQAGETVDTSWLGGKWTVLSLEREVIGQAAELDANEGTKTLAQYLLALVGLDLGDEAEAGRLAKFLVKKEGENQQEKTHKSGCRELCRGTRAGPGGGGGGEGREKLML